MRKHMLGTITALLTIVLVAGAQTRGSEAVNAALTLILTPAAMLGGWAERETFPPAPSYGGG